MPLWRLTPIDLSDPQWQHTQPKPILVQGQDEREARQLAKYQTLEFTPVVPGRKITFSNPWQDSGLTTCEQVPDSDAPPT